jgi:hypothetical protein
MLRRLSPLPSLGLCLGVLGPAPAFAQHLLPASNGHGAAVYDVGARKVADLRPAIFQAWGPGDFVPDLLFDAYFGLRSADGATTWLTDAPVERAGYVPGTGIIEVEQRVAGRTVVTSVFAPWDWAAPAVAMLAEVRNPQPGDHLVTLHNLHLGRNVGGAFVGAEEILPLDGGAVREAGDRYTVVHRPLVPPVGLAVPPENPFVLAQAGRPFPSPASAARTVTDDAVVGFEFAPGADGTLRGGVVIGALPAGAPPEVSRAAEEALWARWQAGLTLPEETPLTRQQAAFLRMGQVRGEGGGRGQILASLPPGIWNISWVRDMAYSVAALSRIGALEEAWAAIDFQLNAEVGDYVEYVGRPYLISVTRYFGNGREESDANQNGPNIEWDDFGLFLWSLGHYEAGGGDLDRIAPHWPRIRSGVLEVIESLVDDLDLLVPDSSIWERHWSGGNLEDGLAQRFAWSSIVNAAGLCHAARLADRLGDDGDRWRALAHRLRRGVETRLVAPDGVLGASLEQVQRGSGYHDLAVVEAFTLGLLPVDGPVAQATWAAVNRTLRVAPERGFKRNDDGVGRGSGPGQAGWYDEQEWVFIDLRTEIWRRAAGLPGADLVAYLRGRGDAAEGRLILPELLGVPNGQFEGAQPMLGFGAGAWLLALDGRPETFCDPPGAAADAGRGGEPVPADAGPLGGSGGAGGTGGTGGTGGPGGTTGGGPTGGGGLPATGGTGGVDEPIGGTAIPPAQDAGRGGGAASEADAGRSGGTGGGGGGCGIVPGTSRAAEQRAARSLLLPLLLISLAAARSRGRRRRDGAG